MKFTDWLITMLQTSLRRVAGTGCVVATLLTLFVAVPRSASAQGTTPAGSIANEYRVTLVATRPAAEREKVVFFGYLGGVSSPDKEVSSLYYSTPGLIIKPKPWAEI